MRRQVEGDEEARIAHRAPGDDGAPGDVDTGEADDGQPADRDQVRELLVAGGHRARPFTTRSTISAASATIRSAASTRWAIEACGPSVSAGSTAPSAASALRMSSTETIDVSPSATRSPGSGW